MRKLQHLLQSNVVIAHQKTSCLHHSLHLSSLTYYFAHPRREFTSNINNWRNVRLFVCTDGGELGFQNLQNPLVAKAPSF